MNNKSPLITKFLDAILPLDLHHLIGDLEEEFHRNKQQIGRTRANLALWSQVIRSLPWFLFQSLIWNTVMIINYLKVSWRNIKAHKSFSLINILGLAASMSVCLLIILFIYDQKSYDRFHEKSDRIYRVISDYKSAGSNTSEWFATSPANLADMLQQQYPGIEKAVPVSTTFGGEAKHTNDIILPIRGFYTDPQFLQIFDFKLLKGNPNTALSEPGSVILTQETATKFYGDDDPIGKTIQILGDRTYTVTGVIDNGVRTHFSFDALASYSSLATSANRKSANWSDNFSNSYTYLLLDENAVPDALKKQISPLIHSSFPEANGTRINAFDLQPITKINLGRILANEIGTVIPAFAGYFLGGFALIIILIACFNYISLTLARSLNRSKEVGVRKVLGAYRYNIIKQFIIEAVLIALIALVFATVILRWLLPEFNSLHLINLANGQIGIDFQHDYFVYFLFICFSITVGVLAGLYPALYLSKFDAATVLKGIKKIRGFSAITLRKIIIVGQFSFAIIFIITSILLYRQFTFMANSDYGFDQEHIVHIALQDVPYDRFRNAVQSNPSITEVAATSKIPALGSINGMWVQSDSVAERIRANSFEVDAHYLDVMNLALITGRNFNPEFGSDHYASVILNQSAVNELNLGTPQQALGAPVTVEDSLYKVIGVIENFISSSPLNNDEAAIILNRPNHYYYAAIKSRADRMQNLLPFIKETWYNMDSKYPIQYQIFDEQLRQNPIISVFGDFIKILGLVAIFIILISCLGLLGMAIYTAESRTKEIGIRKVLGASVKDIILLLSKDYLLLIGIAALIGGPAAWFLNQFWLQNISNKIEVGPRIFVIGILGVILLALLTIGSQTIRAARANSVENLQSE